jgi:hypothetical protein
MKLLNLGAVKEERNACMAMVMAWHGMAYDYHASLVLTCKGFVGDGVIGANAAAEVEEGRKEERRELVKQQRWQRTKCRQRRQGCHTRTL